jgi:hypothetical protein
MRRLFVSAVAAASLLGLILSSVEDVSAKGRSGGSRLHIAVASTPRATAGNTPVVAGVRTRAVTTRIRDPAISTASTRTETVARGVSFEVADNASRLIALDGRVFNQE